MLIDVTDKHVYVPTPAILISKIEKCVCLCQGTGGAFLGNLAEDGIRCIVRGYSCFDRLFENPCMDLIHRNKKQ